MDKTTQLQEKMVATNEALLLGSLRAHELTEAAVSANALLQIEVTERKRAEKVSARLAAIVESSDDAIIGKDLNSIITSWNRGAENIFGYAASEMVGASIMRIIPEDRQDEEKTILGKIKQGQSVAHFDTLRQTKNGRLIDVEITASPIKDDDGKPIGASKVARDITERKRAEEQLKKSLKELADLNTEIQEFYHTLSHELKTPLTSAREFISILMDGLAGPMNETQLEYLGIAKESCDQLRRYINDLLDVTRLETGKMSIEFHALPLASLVERVVEMLAPAAAGKGISLSCECQPDLPAVPIDKERILQVLTNLTTNAMKFTPVGGHIHLSLTEASSDPEYLQINVRDTGQGVPKDQLHVIFNRRYQANHNTQSVESQTGLGLGLYICQELVSLHGGRIWAESEIGKGSTFSFVVPKRVMSKRAHVLIVDDDCELRQALCFVLEDNGFDVATVAGGREALDLMGQRTPDVVVLDLLMAGMDGPNTLKEIRKNFGPIPVIVLTGYPDSNLMQRALESCPFTLLAKPCPPKRFVETVRQICYVNDKLLKKKNKRSPVNASAKRPSSGESKHPTAPAASIRTA